MRRVELGGERPATAPGTLHASVKRLAAGAHTVVIEIGAGGVVGRHPAGASQLFVVVRGSGWVSGGDGERQPIEAGEAVAWDPGEEHESGSDDGMTAIVVEAKSLDS